MWNPGVTNISYSNYNQYSYWAKEIAKNLVLRYYSQGGTEYENLQPFMMNKFKYLLEKMGDEIWEIHVKAFKVMGEQIENG